MCHMTEVKYNVKQLYDHRDETIDDSMQPEILLALARDIRLLFLSCTIDPFN